MVRSSEMAGRKRIFLDQRWKIISANTSDSSQHRLIGIWEFVYTELRRFVHEEDQRHSENWNFNYRISNTSSLLNKITWYQLTCAASVVIATKKGCSFVLSWLTAFRYQGLNPWANHKTEKKSEIVGSLKRFGLETNVDHHLLIITVGLLHLLT